MSNRFYGNILAGTNSISATVLLRSNATNLELTGVTVSNALSASYWRQGQARVGLTLSSLASLTTSYTSGGWFEVDSTNMPGIYRMDLPDDSIASGADWVIVSALYTSSYIFAERFNLENDYRAADVLLDRDMSSGPDNGSTTRRTPRQALRILRNKWGITNGTLTVNKEDDATASWTAGVSSESGAQPITGVDPA